MQYMTWGKKAMILNEPFEQMHPGLLDRNDLKK